MTTDAKTTKFIWNLAVPSPCGFYINKVETIRALRNALPVKLTLKELKRLVEDTIPEVMFSTSSPTADPARAEYTPSTPSAFSDVFDDLFAHEGRGAEALRAGGCPDPADTADGAYIEDLKNFHEKNTKDINNDYINALRERNNFD